ncbi:MAG: exonuclease subunit SbcD [Treponema sp.]|jgi:exonuclease SbcD|nr:exonuclease subunit SbcD [Treponema sp.]
MIKALHTSDWHLGAQLYEKDRLDEQRLFLRWLTETIKEEQIRLLVVSGDIFDSYVPPAAAQALYYEFLAAMLHLETRPELVITAGNHDSPQFLNAPREILSHLRIHVIPGIDRNVMAVRDEQNNPALAVCAVPFLRERDLGVIAGFAEPSAQYREAAAAHYRKTVEQARREMPGIPLLVMGHLFVSGSALSDDVSERLREVGRLSSLPVDILGEADYHALGHLHRPQAVNGNERCRYSGSPIPMSFGEAGQAKSVAIITFDNQNGQHDLSSAASPRIEVREIPRFSKLEQIRGDAETIRKRLEAIQAANEEVYIDIQVTGSAGNIHDFWDELNVFKAGALERRAPFSILAAQDMREISAGVSTAEIFTEVSSIEPADVFERKLDEEHIEGPERETYRALFKEIEARVRSGEALEAEQHED